MGATTFLRVSSSRGAWTSPRAAVTTGRREESLVVGARTKEKRSQPFDGLSSLLGTSLQRPLCKHFSFCSSRSSFSTCPSSRSLSVSSSFRSSRLSRGSFHVSPAAPFSSENLRASSMSLPVSASSSLGGFAPVCASNSAHSLFSPLPASLASSASTSLTRSSRRSQDLSDSPSSPVSRASFPYSLVFAASPHFLLSRPFLARSLSSTFLLSRSPPSPRLPVSPGTLTALSAQPSTFPARPSSLLSPSRAFACRPGATRMKWYFQKPYVRRVKSDFFRFPLLSQVTKQKIDWQYHHPRSGYEAACIFGPNTLEVTNLPMGKTCEYLQERLWRFFGKFGIVEQVRVLPHERDPYQTCGTAYVCFRSRMASLRAVRLPVHLPASLHNRVLHLRHLGTDRTSDDLFYFRRQQAISNLVAIAQQLYAYLEERGPLPAHRALRLLFERSYPRLAWRQAGVSVRTCCGSWLGFFSRSPFNELFYLAREDEVARPTEVTELEADPRASRKMISNEGTEGAAETRGRKTKSKLGDTKDGTSPGLKSLTDREENAMLEKMVIFPHLLSREKLQALLLRAGRLLQMDLQNELSVHWRTDRPPLPDWTQKQIQLWQHQDPLPEELQIWSRTKDYYKIHEERFLFKLKLKKERAQARQEMKQQRRRLELQASQSSS
ncbi:hypothetical protein TGARI_259850 [Toxoplasma gondii ARI]|uniref:RRM domain-containing protein n=1 Tax=Toxoplasma gondii ARI TaxID=1074872 RepID=A0A139XS72_TOXGO|nr:hypothetical protein TGARI_259850 [Toxoplasma gondii ARI]